MLVILLQKETVARCEKEEKQRREVARGSLLLSIWINTSAGDRETAREACKSGQTISSGEEEVRPAADVWRR